MIDIENVSFFKELQRVGQSMRTSVNGVDWARAYLGANGKPSIRYRCGERIRRINATDEIVEFSNGGLCKSYVDVDLGNLSGATRYESERVQHALTHFNDVELKSQRLVPSDDFIPKQRW